MELQDSIVRGFIKEYDDVTVLIDVINDFGEKNGISKILLDEIVKMDLR